MLPFWAKFLQRENIPVLSFTRIIFKEKTPKQLKVNCKHGFSGLLRIWNNFDFFLCLDRARGRHWFCGSHARCEKTPPSRNNGMVSTQRCNKKAHQYCTICSETSSRVHTAWIHYPWYLNSYSYHLMYSYGSFFCRRLFPDGVPWRDFVSFAFFCFWIPGKFFVVCSRHRSLLLLIVLHRTRRNLPRSKIVVLFCVLPFENASLLKINTVWVRFTAAWRNIWWFRTAFTERNSGENGRKRTHGVRFEWTGRYWTRLSR